MAHITDKKTIFFVTSPRTPIKMKEEVGLLVSKFSGKKWNAVTQKEFYLDLSKQEYFEGSPTGDMAFKSRDRINRAPKSLGLIDLKPVIALTPAGKAYLSDKRPEEAFLRQLLKFQLPSPYHIDKNNEFNVKPYLELMRLVHELNGLNKNEIALFVMQLTHFDKYNEIKEKILHFRNEVKSLRERKISYKKFVADKFKEELSCLFQAEIGSDDIKTRETEEVSLKKFIDTKRNNHLDYADASIRYLRGSGLFSYKPLSSKIFVIAEKEVDLKYILENVKRSAEIYASEEEYGNYLFSSTMPALLSDNKEALVEKIISIGFNYKENLLREKKIEELKDIYEKVLKEKLSNLVENEKQKLQTYEEYEDIVKVFSQIENKEIIDPPLFLEWNTWRALAMLDDGNIQGNFKIDDEGIPLYTAQGNTPDIICKYNDFEMIVEVTMSSGQKQYEMEGEPVARHLGKQKKTTDKEVYCLFIAPQLNQATVAHFYMLYRSNIDYYGGKAKIIPLSLKDFKIILENANKAKTKPNSSSIKKFMEDIARLAEVSKSETDWQEKISSYATSVFV